MKDHLLQQKLTLNVKIDDESQLYSNYGYNGDNLAPELSDYLIKKAEDAFPLPRKKNFLIKIRTQNPNLRLSEATRSIHRHFHNAYDTAKRELRATIRLGALLFGLGMFALVLQFFAEQIAPNEVIDFFLTEILNIAAWVFTWGALEVVILDRHQVMHRCELLRRLAFAEVAFTYDNKIETPVYI